VTLDSQGVMQRIWNLQYEAPRSWVEETLKRRMQVRLRVLMWVKGHNQKSQGLIDFPVEPLRPIIMLERFEKVTLDYADPFEAVQGHSYILVLIENMTGYLDLAICRMATGDATVKMLKTYCLRYGFPRVTHTDRGPHFHKPPF